MKKVTLFILSLFILFSCTEYEGIINNYEYVYFNADSYNVVVDLGASTTQTLTISTTTLSSSNKVFNVEIDESSSVNPNSYTLPSIVTLSANEKSSTLDINISSENISSEGETLVLKLVDQDGLFISPTVTVDITLNCPTEPTPGIWTVKMLDDIGDGWDESFITITIDDVSTNYTVEFQEVEATFDVPEGASEISVIYTLDTPYPEEISFQIIAPGGGIVMDEIEPTPNVPLTFNYCLF